MIPGGKLGRAKSDTPFNTTDFRFTVGKYGTLYAICMSIPKPGETLQIKSLGMTANRLNRAVRNMKMLGQQNAALTWKQEADQLVIKCPQQLRGETAITFVIE